MCYEYSYAADCLSAEINVVETQTNRLWTARLHTHNLILDDSSAYLQHIFAWKPKII